MTTLRAEEPLPAGKLDPKHYRSIHRHLFQDVYAWAGRYRTVRSGKGENWFCYPEHIAASMDRLFATLTTGAILHAETFEEFIALAVPFLAELNAIHAFREGNGRTQLAFMHILAERAGHPINLAYIDPQPFEQAMIRSFADDYQPLIQQFRRLNAH